MSEGLGSAAFGRRPQRAAEEKSLLGRRVARLSPASLPILNRRPRVRGGDLCLLCLNVQPSTYWSRDFSLPTPKCDRNFGADTTDASEVQRCSGCSAARGCAALEVFNSRRQALSLLLCGMACSALPNVRHKPAPTARRRGRAADDELHCSAAPVACCWGSA